MKEYRFKVPAEIYFTVQAQTEQEARTKAVGIVEIAADEELPVSFEALVTDDDDVSDDDLEEADGCAYFSADLVGVEIVHERELEDDQGQAHQPEREDGP